MPADGRCTAAGWHAARRPLAAALTASLLAGCTSFTFLADPGKYEFYSCQQLANDMTSLTKKRQDLKALMDRADQGTGGTAVGLMAYRTDYINAGEEQKLLDSAARSKSCTQPETWRSNGAVQ